MPVYSRDQFKDHIADKSAPSGGLEAAIHDPAGQLPLFAQSREVLDAAEILPGEYDAVDGRREHYDEFWERKLNEASIPGRYEKPGAAPSEGASLREDIGEQGVQKPVRMAGAPAWGKETGSPFDQGTVLDGYHRLAVMAEDHPDSWVPLHFEQGPTKTGELDKR
jgi:hypothetical protein